MGAIGCWIWWLLLGILIGFLLNWLLSRLLRKDPPAVTTYPETRVVPPPVAAVQTPTTPIATPSAGIDLDAARRAGFNPRHANDLELIDGIGPKIEELFHQRGVTTFTQVAAMSVAEMKAILDAGGSRFSLADPTTWARQARMILDNRWDEFKSLGAQAGNPPTAI